MTRSFKVHLNQIPEYGPLHVEDELDPAFLNLEETEWQAASPLRIALDVGVSGTGVFALGIVSIDLTARCVKCLQDFSETLRAPEIALQQEIEGREVLDLTDDLREDILLLLPSHPRCDTDGNRECPATFRTAPNVPLAREKDVPSDAWNVLDQFKPKK